MQLLQGHSDAYPVWLSLPEPLQRLRGLKAGERCFNRSPAGKYPELQPHVRSSFRAHWVEVVLCAVGPALIALLITVLLYSSDG